MSAMITPVFVGDAKYGRRANLYLLDGKVIFDCSEGEYGPIEFPIEQLIEALIHHKINDKINEQKNKKIER